MAQAQTSRRSFLSQTAGVAAGGAVLAMALPVPVTAATPQRVPDPILEAIEAHKAAFASWMAALDWHYELDRELPVDKCLSSVDFWEEKIVGTDDPRWIECQRRVHVTNIAEIDATCVLVDVRPTTMAGLMALLEHALKHDRDGEAWPTDLKADDGRKRSWHHFLIESVAEVLPELMPASA